MEGGVAGSEGETANKASQDAKELVARFLEALHASDACVSELQSAVQTGEQRRLIDVRVTLEQIWTNAQTYIRNLESISNHTETAARDALRQSQERAREPLRQAWTAIMANKAHAAHAIVKPR